MPYVSQSLNYPFPIPKRSPDGVSFRFDIPQSVTVLRPITGREYADAQSARFFAQLGRQPRKTPHKRLKHRDRLRVPAGDHTLLRTTTRDVTQTIPGRPVTALSVTDTSKEARLAAIAADLKLHRAECARRRNAAAHSRAA